jgi:6-pyruvoyltetrahydropterin/6-carboxytetrahydropterin synthase
MDMKVLKDYIKTEVEDYLDHKNLNIQVVEFKTLNPTAEHIAYVIWNRLRSVINKNLELKVTLYETPRNYVEYNGK